MASASSGVSSASMEPAKNPRRGEFDGDRASERSSSASAGQSMLAQLPSFGVGQALASRTVNHRLSDRPGFRNTGGRLQLTKSPLCPHDHGVGPDLTSASVPPVMVSASTSGP